MNSNQKSNLQKFGTIGKKPQPNQPNIFKDADVNRCKKNLIRVTQKFTKLSGDFNLAWNAICDYEKI